MLSSRFSFIHLFLIPIFILVLGNLSIYAQVIPAVHKVKNEGKGFLDLKRDFVVETNHPSLAFESSYLSEYLDKFKPQNVKKSENPVKIKLLIDHKFKSNSKEVYSLKITKNLVSIKAKEASGVFRGISTFIHHYAIAQASDFRMNECEIIDEPKFSWRGMHLDVCRHFFTVDFIKKYIDLLALYKMNVFHWHLTEDQGWRIEIKKYPKLTEIGAWRNGTMVGPYSNQYFDTIRYGGFYTQDEIREVVKYATDRHITVVPEIEMPGHALAALASYPEFSCSGGPFEVAKGWGVFDDVFCAKDETFQFLEDVLSEVLELFPSQYIHIGGDECPKTRWKSCEHCQNTIKANQLKDEHELQSYFIRRIEKFLNSKGRKLIGWDEILEGGLAPEATVMSWRGVDGGIAAAKMKHDVVMSPGSHCYFDHYQGDPKHEPLAFGGYTPLEKVYNFNPIPDALSNEEAKYILGGQANVWTEYISGTREYEKDNFKEKLNFWKSNMTPEQHVEYMVLPRLLALSEVLWGTANPSKYDEFLKRVIQHKKNILEPLCYNSSNSIYEIKMHVFEKDNELYAELSSPLIKNLYYGIEWQFADVVSGGNFSQLYNQELKISQSCDLYYYHEFDGIYASNTLSAFNNKRMSYSERFHVNKATAKPIQLVHDPHKNYSYGGSFTLVNGIQAPREHLGKDWLGFSGTDLIATVDLLDEKEINTLGIGLLQRQGSWIYYPTKVLFEVSDDGINFNTVLEVLTEEINIKQGKIELKLPQKHSARFARITANNFGVIPEGLPGAGNRAWLFVDEILID